MLNPEEIINTLNRASEVNLTNPYRQGNIVRLTGNSHVVMTGDLHGSEKNFDKIVHFAKLGQSKDNHLILHELIHDPHSTNPHECHSYNLVFKAAQLLINFPGQVHYIMGNHAMAQVTSEEVLKAGKPMVKSLNTGMVNTFGMHYIKVYKALETFFLSLPLVVRTANNIWLSHSLPDAGHLAKFDYGLFDAKLTVEYMKNSPSMRALLWDRKHSNELLQELSHALHIETFIVGHQPQQDGASHPYDRLIILASDHNLGCILTFDTNVKYTSDELYSRVVKIAKI